MAFRKRFPKDVPTSPYPQWRAVTLTKQQEEEIVASSQQQNLSLLKQCLQQAKVLVEQEGLKDYQTDIVTLAVALFEKQASHVAYHKEEYAYDLFMREEAEK
ncbi:MAG: hypothetical protein ACMXYD_01610 [Candidatus Woesearchaeota archaeon]